jgi:protein-S-isoprenylcysteine O-methyltransferase Ste14
MDRSRSDLAIRTLFWLAFAVLWAYLSQPEAGGFLAIQSGFSRLLGIGLIAGGVALYVWCVRLLADAAPIILSSPKALLRRGPYGHVRNPLYLSIAAILAGISTLYAAWSAHDLVRAAIVALCAHIGVVRFEEPATRRALGAAYDEYCRLVPRWIPRF